MTADECALASTSDDASIWQNKGKALCYLGRDEEALTAYERALALDPRHALAWAYMGHVLRTMRRSKEALDAYDRAISIQPTAWFWYGKAKALRALGREAEAQKAAKRAKELGW